MALEPKLIHKLIYKLKLTPQMKLSINLLQLPLAKLKEYINQEIEKNPLLEIERAGLPPKSKYESGENSDIAANPPTLQEHLLRQLHLLTESDEERKIGELIIGNINDNGYLECSMEEIAKIAETSVSKVEKVLSLIQTFDPIGVGAKDLRECLLLQLKAKGEENSLAWQIIDKYLSSLEKKKYKYIAEKLKVSIDRMKEIMKGIAHLEPKPGRSFSAERTMRLIPDATLRKNKEGYEVIYNDWELPRLTLNSKYTQMIKQKAAPKDAKVYLKERLDAARTLIDAIKRRKETIKKVMEEIVSCQKDFLNNGEANFKPMTLDKIAEKIGKHKSTVSRAMANKYLQTPYGIFELRYFLSSGVRQESGEILSSKAIKSKIVSSIANENKEKPLTDREIVNLLKKDGVSIACRTVAKYRKQFKILSSRSRRK